MRSTRRALARQTLQLRFANHGFQHHCWTFGAGGIRNPAASVYDPGPGRGFTMIGNPVFQNDPGTIVRLPVANPTLLSLMMVLGDFRRQTISYCYWKSSNRIQSVLAGEGDIELLIARHDQHRAEAILLVRGL